MTHTNVLPFDAPADAPSADLDSVGGKGLSFARMTAAGFPAPRRLCGHDSRIPAIRF